MRITERTATEAVSSTQGPPCTKQDVWKLVELISLQLAVFWYYTGTRDMEAEAPETFGMASELTTSPSSSGVSRHYCVQPRTYDVGLKF